MKGPIRPRGMRAKRSSIQSSEPLSAWFQAIGGNQKNISELPTSPIIIDHTDASSTSANPQSPQCLVDRINERTNQFESCRQTLRDALKSAQHDELSFRRTCVAISCVLNSFRILHISELETAVDLIVCDDRSNSPTRPRLPSDEAHDNLFEKIIQRTDNAAPLFLMDDVGLVTLASKLMPQFLRCYRIRGIDTTHETIASACLAQIHLNRESALLAAPDILAVSHFTFSGYAARYWRGHCCYAEQQGRSLNMSTSLMHHPSNTIAAPGGSRHSCDDDDDVAAHPSHTTKTDTALELMLQHSMILIGADDYDDGDDLAVDIDDGDDEWVFLERRRQHSAGKL